MSLRARTGWTQYRGHEQITAPSVEPVTAEELAFHLRLEYDAGDTQAVNELERFIAAAREVVEEWTGRALITQSWRLTLDRWPGYGEPWWDGVRQGAIQDLYAQGMPAWVMIPRYRLQTVDKVETFDLDGTASAITVADTFVVDTQQEPGRLALKNTATWPVALQRVNSIQIDYTAGYGDESEDVPASLRNGLLMLAAQMCEHRGDGCSTADHLRMSGAESVFRQYKAARL